MAQAREAAEQAIPASILRQPVKEIKDRSEQGRNHEPFSWSTSVYPALSWRCDSSSKEGSRKEGWELRHPKLAALVTFCLT